jgi:hypothetical protein
MYIIKFTPLVLDFLQTYMKNNVYIVVIITNPITVLIVFA